MAQGQKITINNTSGRQLVISYQRISDFLWIYNEPVKVGQTKTIFTVENTLKDIDIIRRFIEIEDVSDVPRVAPTRTPTQTRTPTPTFVPKALCLDVIYEIPYKAQTIQLGSYNGKPYYGVYDFFNVLIPNYLIKFNSNLQRWEFVTNGLSDTNPNSVLINSSSANSPIGQWTSLVNCFTQGMCVDKSYLCDFQVTPTPTKTPISNQNCYDQTIVTINWTKENCTRPLYLYQKNLSSYTFKVSNKVANESFSESCLLCQEWQNRPNEINNYSRAVESNFEIGNKVYVGWSSNSCDTLGEKGWYFLDDGCSGDVIYVDSTGTILSKGRCGQPQPPIQDIVGNYSGFTQYVDLGYLDCCGIERYVTVLKGQSLTTEYVITGSTKGGSVFSPNNQSAISDIKYNNQNTCQSCCSTPTPTPTKTSTPTPTSVPKVKVVLTCCAAPDTNTSNIEVELPSNFDPEVVYMDDLGMGWYYAGPGVIATSTYKPKTLDPVGQGVIETCLKIAEVSAGPLCVQPDIFTTPTPTPSVGANNIYLIGCCCNEGYVIKPNAPLIAGPTQFEPNQLYIDNLGYFWISILEPESGITLNTNVGYTPIWYTWFDTNNEPFDFCFKYCEATECKPFNVTTTPTPTSTPTVTPTLTNVNNSYCHIITNTGSTNCIVKWIDRYFDKNEVCIQTGETLTVCAIVGSVETNCLIENNVIIEILSPCNDLTDCLPTPTPSATPTSTPDYGECKEFIVTLDIDTYLKYAEAVGTTEPSMFSTNNELQIPETPFTDSVYFLSYIDCCNNLITIPAKLYESTKICAKSITPSIFYNSVVVGTCTGSCTSALNVVINKKSDLVLSAVTCDGRTVTWSEKDINPGTWFFNYTRFNNLSKTCFQKGSFITSNPDVTFDYITTQTTVFPCDCEVIPKPSATPTSTPTPTVTQGVCSLYRVTTSLYDGVFVPSSALTYTFEYIGIDGNTVYDTIVMGSTKIISALRPPISTQYVNFSLLGPCQGSSICITYEPKVEGYLPGTIISENLTPQSTLRNGKLWYKSKNKVFWEIYWETASGPYQNKWVVKTPSFVDSLYRCTGVTNSYLNSSADVPLSNSQTQWINLPSSASCRSIIVLSSSEICPTPTPTKTPTKTPTSTSTPTPTATSPNCPSMCFTLKTSADTTFSCTSSAKYDTIINGYPYYEVYGSNCSTIIGYVWFGKINPEAPLKWLFSTVLNSEETVISRLNNLEPCPVGSSGVTGWIGTQYIPLLPRIQNSVEGSCTKLCYSTVTFDSNPYLNPYVSYYDCCEGIRKSIILQSGATSFTANKGCIQEGSFYVSASNGSNQPLNYSYLNQCDCETPTPTITPTPTTPCQCVDNFVKVNSNICAKDWNFSPQTNVVNSPVSPVIPAYEFGDFGYYIYSLDGFSPSGYLRTNYAYNGFNGGSNSTMSQTDLFWKNRLNSIGLWIQDENGIDFVGTLKYCFQFTAQTEQLYYFGLGVDNYATIRINDRPFIVNPINEDSSRFKLWHIYPVILSAGTHTIEVSATNLRLLGAFGCEIYQNSLNELLSATSINDLNIVFSTGDFLDSRSVSGHTTDSANDQIKFIGNLPRGSRYGQNYCSSTFCVAPRELLFTAALEYDVYLNRCTVREIYECPNPPSFLVVTPTPTKTPTPTI